MGEYSVKLIELIAVQLVHAKAFVHCLSREVLQLDVESYTFHERIGCGAFFHMSVKRSEDTFLAGISVDIHRLDPVDKATKRYAHLVGEHGGSNRFLFGVILVPSEEVTAKLWVVDAPFNCIFDKRAIKSLVLSVEGQLACKLDQNF